jgi:dihydropyrimidinase
MLDLLIRGGKVVSPETTLEQDVGIRDGKVVSLTVPGAGPAEAARVVDARGKYVLPGGIDAHVHFGIQFPAFKIQAPFDASRAAACGGTTTVIDFAWQQHPHNTLMEAIQTKRAEMDEAMVVDYGLHAIISGDVEQSVIEEVPSAIEYGIPTIKLFTCFPSGPGSAGFMVEDGRIWGIFQQLSAHGGMAVLHVEDQCIIEQATRQLFRQGRTEGKYIGEARPHLAEVAALNRMLVLAHWTKTPIYFVHMSTKEGVAAIADARAQRRPVYGEVLHHYLNFTNDDYFKPNGLIYHNYPPLRPKEDQDALWAWALDGSLNVVASDDFTVPLADKLMGQTVDNVTGGNNGVEIRLPIMFSEGVSKGRMSVNRMVALTSTNPAKVFGMYPKKGFIGPGGDADVVVIDPDLKKTITLADLHSACDYTAWEGWELHGYPIMTVARGSIVMEDGRFLGARGAGRFIPRTLSPEVLAGPAVT